MRLLCERLLALGLHQVDVGDAIDEANRKWFQQKLDRRNSKMG